MKVLQLTNSLITGGAEKLLFDAIPFYQKKGINIDLLVLDGTEHPLLSVIKKNEKIRIYSFGKGSVYNPFLVFKIIPFLKKYDVVHVHLFPALYWVALAKSLSFANTKIIFTEHSTLNRRRNLFGKYFDKFIYSKYSKIIAISELVRENLKKHLNFDDKRFSIIENGVDLEKISTALASENDFFQNSDPNQKIIIQVSRFIYPKDQKTVINALKYLPSSIKLILVGDGILRKDCENLVEQLKLEDRVNFLGVRMDVPQLLKSSDIIVLSSVYEGLSLSSIEGMASGKPFIASDVPGLTEAVKGAGLLFPQGNSKELADQILKLVNNPSYYSDVSKKCIERSKEFDIEKMVDSYINLYKELE
ncbi:glycosyltransferase family 4 protein [Aequorivita todarodis]|uniref:glycosyltransferase family 4 protein n=1 Tax=Aequorivita todarodis TaxID=2036821 RepID=UPI002350D495|nr:glycosyltransferase family 4 protein [Aequorivita todarodis]MDC8000251.1 glycosyltransferase family 4 protein [Aequorivita todarodis]